MSTSVRFETNAEDSSSKVCFDNATELELREDSSKFSDPKEEHDEEGFKTLDGHAVTVNREDSSIPVGGFDDMAIGNKKPKWIRTQRWPEQRIGAP